MAKMKKRAKGPTVEELIHEIGKRLDSLEEVMAFTTRANARFVGGEKVKLSDRAQRKGLRLKGGVRTGKVVSVSDGLTIDVLVDGYKRPHTYHHMYFDLK